VSGLLFFFDAAGKSLISYKCDALEILNGKLGHEIHSVRVPKDWPAACYKPLPVGFDPKTHDVRWKTPVAAVALASVRENDNAQDALAAGRYIPHLCYHPEFKPHGSCKVCTVKVGGRTAASCTLPART